MLQYRWISKTITTNRAANEMIDHFEKIQPKIGAIDTEADGFTHNTKQTIYVSMGVLTLLKK